MTKPIEGTVAWVDLQTPDLDRARGFYGELLGWKFEGGDDPNLGHYTTALFEGKKVAGLAKLGGDSPFPPMWSVYLAADDVDALARRVRDNGGEIVAEPMDIPDQGRMAYFKDPTGAYFGAWQSGKHQGAELRDQPGAMAWSETYTRDAKLALPFYEKVAGVTGDKMPVTDFEYWSLMKGKAGAFGLMQMPSHFPEKVPSHWNTYFGVPDADAAVEKVKALGGSVVSPAFDSPYGRIAFLTDPFGANFNVMQPMKR